MRRAKDVRWYRRLQAVRLVAGGMPVRGAGDITGTKPCSIYGWVRRYLRSHDPKSLRDLPRSGRPRAAKGITGALIARELERKPMRLGYNATGWTVSLLARHLRAKYGKSFSDPTLRRRMREMGLRWKRPRYVYSTKDPNRAQKKGALYGA